LKAHHHERALLEILLVMIGVPAERAHCDATIIHFMMGGKRARQEAHSQAVPDARSEVPSVRGVQHAGTGMRTRLQRLLSFLHVTSRVP
jgi:hypothetical protein